MIKSRQLRWVGFVACVEHKRNAQCFGGGTWQNKITWQT